MEVKIISKETIKPSSPTPTHLRNFQCSLLDHLAPNIYVPILLFYSDDDTNKEKNSEKMHRLKSSLLETLTRFYPLAGRIIKHDLVDCNDEGVNFYNAQVDCQLTEVLRRPDDEKLKQLLPSDYSSLPSSKGVLLAVQVNIFDCGQTAIGVCMSHKIGDAMTLLTFLNGWAARAHGSNEVTDPTFDSASLFPIGDVPRLENNNLITKEKIVTKSFMFDESKIDILRGKDQRGASVGYPTRVESVSALIWRCAMRAQAKVRPRRLSVATHPVNLRGRMVPPLPEYSFGNIFVLAVALGEVESECQEDMQRCLELRFRDAFRIFNADYIKKMQLGLYEHMRGHIVAELSTGNLDFYNFTSWCRFPFYDVDFGWGKPIWVSSASFPIKNSFLLMGTRWGDGMEVWSNMAKEDMVKFEYDEELLTYASPRAVV